MIGVVLATAISLLGVTYNTLKRPDPALEERVAALEKRRGTVPISQEADDRLSELEIQCHELRDRLDALERKEKR